MGEIKKNALATVHNDDQILEALISISNQLGAVANRQVETRAKINEILAILKTNGSTKKDFKDVQPLNP